MDADAALVIVNQGVTVRARIFELSVDGCRVRTDKRHSLATPAAIEVMFKINGIGFRLAGIMQWADSHQTAGIQFAPMVPRRHQALMELLAELESEEKAMADQVESERSDTDVPGTSQAGSQPVTAREPAPVRARESRGLSTDPPLPASVSPASPPVTASSAAPNPATTEPEGQAARPAAASRRERRAQTRHTVDTRATIFFIDVRAQICGRILDLSMSGCRIRTDERFPVGIYRRVETEFKLDGLPFRLAGVVQSLHDKYTVGLRFLDMSSRKRDQLAQLMEEIEEMRAVGNANQDPATRNDGPLIAT